MKPVISIIMPNYNNEKYLEKSISSILKQKYTKWKLIIVDDCSNNQNLAILNKYKHNKKINIFFLKKNMGAAYCRNFALKKINTEYIAFIDSDDLWHKNKLLKQINFMKKNNYAFTFTFYKTFNDQNSKKNFIKTNLMFNFKDFSKNTSIGTSTIIIKKNLTNNLKFKNTPICEDYFYKCQLLKKIKYAYCLPLFLTDYQIRKNSLQSNKWRNAFWIWKINKKYNKFNFFENFISLLFISLNSIKKYGFK